MSSASGERSAFNQSIARAARLLDLFTPDQSELSLSDMAAQLGVSRATAHRYASALRAAGLLRMTATGYSLGPRIIELASTAVAGLRVVTLAGPCLARLVTEVNETAVLSVWDGEAPIVVRVDDNTNRLVRITVRPGSRLGHDTAQSKIFRAFPPIAERELAGVRDEGIAFSASSVEGVGALACPVTQVDEIVATIALVGTLTNMESAVTSTVGEALRRTADDLSKQLG
jgi:DNA-binding IclR family transcriptional regulator